MESTTLTCWAKLKLHIQFKMLCHSCHEQCHTLFISIKLFKEPLLTVNLSLHHFDYIWIKCWNAMWKASLKIFPYVNTKLSLLGADWKLHWDDHHYSTQILFDISLKLNYKKFSFTFWNFVPKMRKIKG